MIAGMEINEGKTGGLGAFGDFKTVTDSAIQCSSLQNHNLWKAQRRLEAMTNQDASLS